MPRLAELQRKLRDAIVGGGEASGVVPLLVGGANPAERLAIHRHHYEASLVGTLIGKFAATTWLIGSALMDDAAKAFVSRHPPAAPCIAEYGGDFPRFLAERAETRSLGCIRDFAELEWHLGHAAIAVDSPAIDLQALAAYGDRVADIGLVVQGGLRYLASPWPVDDLMRLYLTETAPDSFVLSATDVWLEIGGSRGAIRFDRLDRGTFVFRRALAEGHTLGVAGEQALEADESLDVGAALRSLIGKGLAIDIRSP